jgi:hypothetical protein
LTIESGGTFQAPNLTSISDFQIVNNSTFSLPAILSPSNSNFTMTNNGVYNHTSPTLTIPSGVTWYENGTESTIGDAQPITDIVVEGTLEFQNQNTDLTPASFESITINNGGVLTHQANSTTQTVALNLNLGELTINEGGAIDVSGKGYKGGTGRQGHGYGPGRGLGIWNYAGGGAGHGGGGGSGGNSSYGGAGGDSYGSVSSPLTIGSGGGNGNYGNGGSGGGAIKLIVNGGVSIEGEILADGGDGGPGNDSGGGGAGGSIWMSATEIAGIGYMSAGGGDGATAGDDGGGGGGGRISLTYASSTLSFSSLALTGGTGFENGEDGTIYIFAPPDPVTNIEPTVSNAQIDLTWVAPTNPYTPAVTDYYVYYKQVEASGWTRIEPDPETSETTASISGLTNGTGYDVKVIAINDAGQSDPAILSNIIPYAPPEAPTNVEAQVNDDGLGNVTVELTFDPPADDGGGVEEYLIYIGDTDVATPWYNSSWSHRSKLTIPAENINEELTNFPVYVNLNDLGEGFFQHTQNNGGDIRVTTDDGITEVPRELVSCDIDNQTGELHFLAPSLSATDNTGFYIYYGNIAESDYEDTDDFGAEKVWENGYKAVFHFEEEGNNNENGYKDSSGNGNDGTGFSMTSDSDIPGVLGKGQTFDGSSDYISFGQNDLSDGYNERTLSLWAKMNTIASLYHHAAGYGSPSNGKAMFIGAKDDILLGGGYGGTAGYDLEVDNFWNTTEAKHLALTYDGSQAKLYKGDTELLSEAQTWNLAKDKAYIGRLVNESDYWNGWVDEVRISNTARSQGWISAEYTNQNTPTDFYTITGYIASATSPPTTISGLAIGETYTFTAKSKNGGGISDFSQPSNEVTLDYEPDAPTGLNVTDAIDSSIDLEWTAPDNVVLPDNLDYHIFYRETGSADWIRIDPDPETSETTASITGLTNGTAYDVAVQAVNDAGKSAYATLDGNIPYSPPSEPRNLQAQVNDDGLGNVTVELTFDPPADDGGGVEGYFIYIGDTDGATPWYNSSWSHRSKLTIPAENINEELTNFPVYVNLNDLGEGFFQHTQNNGGDIRVTTDDGITEVPRELVSCDIDNQTGELHFLAPSLSSTDNTGFYIYYGNIAESDYEDTDDFGAEKVWENGYKAVFHFEEEGNNNENGYKDSSGNGNDGTGFSMTSDSDIPGVLGKGQTFDGSSDYISFGQNDLSDGYNERTLSLWAKMNTIASLYHHAAGYGSPSNGKAMFIGAKDDILLGGGYGGTAGYDLEVDNFWNTTEAKHLALTYDGSQAKLYKGDTELLSEAQTWNLAKDKAYIGRLVNDSDYWNGWVDEVRISNTARSQGWISAEYTNQNTPTDFYTITGYIASTPSSPAILTGLTLGETYTFTAKSKNGGGISDFSQPSNEVTLDYEPNAPTGLNVTDAIDSSIDLEWTAPDNVVLPDNMDYHIFYRETGSADWIRIEPDPETSETTASITGLTNGTAYDVAVQAVNDAGKSAYATLDGNIPYSPPSEPRNLQAQVNDDGLGNVTVELTFDPPADDGGGVEVYRVYPHLQGFSDWSSVKQLIIPASNIDATLTDFPVYVNLTDLGTDFFQNTQNNGGDIRITESDGTTEVPRELVFCDIANEKGELHFKADLSNTEDNIFYIYYGNATEINYPANHEFGSHNVWEESLKANWHLGENPAGAPPQMIDFTEYGNNGITYGSMTSDQIIDGKVGKALSFDGVNDYVTMPSSNLDFLGAANQSFTISTWIKADNTGSHKVIADKTKIASGTAWVIFQVLSSGEIDGQLYNGSINPIIRTSSSYEEPIWHLATLIRDASNSTMELYVDEDYIGATYADASIDYSDTIDFSLGSRQSGTDRYFSGSIDDVRVYDKAQSSHEIFTRYKNQSSPDGFYTIIAEDQFVEGLSSPLTIPGLLLGETYTFTAKSKNGGGISDFSQPSNEVTLDYEPDAPNGLNVTDAIDSSIDLEWTAPDNVVLPDNLDYHIFYRETGSADWIRIEPDPETSETTASITGLTNGTAYDVAVQAVNDAGKSAYATLDGNIPYSPPSEPRNLQAQVNDDGLGNVTVELTFDPPADDGGGVEEYFIYIGDTDGATPWYNSSWSHRSKLTIPAENINEELTNFPVYVNLNDLGEDFFQHTQNNGGDIRVTTDDGITEVPRELVSCDIDNQTGELHFLAPSLSATDNTDFFIYYGNASGSDYPDDNPNGAEAVWINNFAFVSHDGGGTGSTSSGINGIPQGGVIAGDSEGRIGDATYFDGSDDGIALGTDLMVVEDFTVSLFTKSTEPFSTTYRPHYFGAGNYFYLITETTGKPKIYRHSSDGWLYAEETTGTQAYNDWVFLSGTYDGSSLKIYENGLHVGSEMATGNLSTPSTDLYVGYAYSGAANQWMHGVIDEVRISNTARSQGWISAEYTNQNTPTDFYTITGYIASTPSSPAILTGLTLGETYTFTAKSKNGGGISDFSQPSNEVTLDYEPDAPNGLNVTDAIDSSIDLEWTAPDNVVLPDNLDYHIFYRETGSADWIRIEPDPETSETTASITGLTNGTAYDVAVQAVNDAGKSAYATLDGNIPYSPPSEPRNLQAQVNDDGLGNVTVELTFDPPADDGGGVEEYFIYIGDTDGATPWYNSSWSHRSKLTIPAENINEELTNFPVYVNLNDLGEDFFQHTQNNGGDIRVTTDDGITEVPRELVSCDIDNQTGELHFLAPSLSATDNSDFFIYYGNASGSDYQDDNPNGAEAVWDDNFVLVSHDGGKTDRTHYGNDGTEQGGVLAGEVPGALGDATEFDGVNDYFTFVDNTSLDVLGGITISSWVKVAQEGGIYYPLIAMRGSPSGSTPLDWQYTWVNRSSDPDYKQMRLNWGGYSVRTKSSSTDIPNDTWQHTAVSFNNAEASFFLVGDPDGVSADATSLTNLATTFLIGSDNQSSFFKGGIDEVRISSVARSASWIAAEYANQSTPNTFYAISSGAELVASGPSSPITISGLTLGETYTFIATAVNAGGESSPSLPSNEVTIDVLPDAVTGLQATISDSQIGLTWTAPTNTTLQVPDYYIFYRETGVTEWTRIDPDPVRVETTASITGLTNGIAYDVGVQAVNDAGQSAIATLEGNIPYAPPTEPLNVTASVENDGALTCAFDLPGDPGGGVDTYDIYTKASGDPDYTKQLTTTELSATIPVASLTLGNTYTCKVKAKNVAGESDFSAPSNEVTIDFLPDPVTDLDATPSDSQIDLTWTAPTNTHLPVPEYIIEYKASSATDWTLHLDLESLGTNASIPNLTNGTAYDVRVAAKNDAGNSDYSSLTNIAPIGVSTPPTGLSFSLLGGGAIELTWEEPDNTGGVLLTDYIIQYKEEFDLDYTTFPDGESTDRSETIGGLDNDQNYFFIVIAVNSEGESLPSEEIPVRLGEPGIISADGMEDTVYPDVTGVFSITNLGSQDYDYQYTWAITESATNTCGGGDDVAGSYDGSITLEPGAVFTGYPISSIASENLEDLPGYADFEEHGMTLYFHVQVEFGFEIRSDFYEFTLTSDAVVPDKPTILSTQPGDRRVGVSWLAPYNNGGDPIIRYHVEYRTGTGTWFDGGESAGTSKTVHGLTNGVQYDFRVYAENVIGNGEPSDIVSATPVYTPKAPTGLAASKASETSILFSWFEPGDTGGRPITDYIVEYRKYNGSWSGWQTYDDGESTEEETILTNLETDYLYELRVYAVNELGIGKRSGTVQVTLGSKPTAPRLTTDTRAEERIDLSISPPIDSGETPITDYQIEYKEGSGAWQIFTDGVNTSTSVLVPNLTTGVTYYFRAAAINGSGMGPYSDEVSDVPATYPGAPTNVVATANADGEIYLSFDYPAFDGHDAIIGYQSKSDPEGRTSSSMPIRVTLGETYTFTVCVRNDIGYGP